MVVVLHLTSEHKKSLDYSSRNLDVDFSESLGVSLNYDWSRGVGEYSRKPAKEVYINMLALICFLNVYGKGCTERNFF